MGSPPLLRAAEPAGGWGSLATVARPRYTTGIMPNREPKPTQALRRWLPAGLWMGLIFYLSAQPDLPLPEEAPDYFSYLAHFCEYAILAGLTQRALGMPAGLRGHAVAFLLAVAYAASDEWHQSFVPGRSCSALDLLADAAGAACALALLARTRALHRHAGDRQPHHR